MIEKLQTELESVESLDKKLIHQDYPELYKAIQDLQTTLLSKRKAYGNSFNDAPQILKHLYPNGVKPHQYEDMLTIVRLLDKLYRIANGADTEDPWQDIAGYAILSMEKNNVRNKSSKET